MIHEHHIQVSRSARYNTLGGDGPRVTEIWFALHGYGQLAPAFARYCQPLAAPHRLVVVPEGLSRFYLGDHTRPAGPDSRIGASWMTREDRLSEIGDYVGYLDQLHQAVRADVGSEPTLDVLGFSQGTATAARWLGRGTARARRLIVWGSPLPTDLETSDFERLRQLEIVLVAGATDEYLTPKVLAGEENRLIQMGARFRTVRFKGGHQLDAPTLAALSG